MLGHWYTSDDGIAAGNGMLTRKHRPNNGNVAGTSVAFGPPTCLQPEILREPDSDGD